MTAGLSGVTLSAVSKLISSQETGEEIIAVIRQALAQLGVKNTENELIDVPVSVKLWQVPGCHELLASLGKSPSLNVIYKLQYLCT